jgi:hypothetical protein
VRDRTKRGLRGPVKTVHWEWFDWNGKALAISEWPTRREELTFSPHGDLLEKVSHFGDGNMQQTIFLYDEAGRLHETKWRNPDGSEGRSTCEYDDHGQRIDWVGKRATVMYSTENGRKVKTEVSNSAGEAMVFNFTDGFHALNSPSWTIHNAAVVSTFYDQRDRPTEMDFYDKEHLQLSKIVRSYDERGSVKSEEQQRARASLPEHREKMARKCRKKSAMCSRRLLEGADTRCVCLISTTSRTA